MRHRLRGRGFNRTSEHRKAMFDNLAAALIKHEQIRTTLPKAKDLRPIVERLITKGKHGGLANRRRAIAALQDTALADKLMTTLAQRYASPQRRLYTHHQGRLSLWRRCGDGDHRTRRPRPRGQGQGFRPHGRRERGRSRGRLTRLRRRQAGVDGRSRCALSALLGGCPRHRPLRPLRQSGGLCARNWR